MARECVTRAYIFATSLPTSFIFIHAVCEWELCGTDRNASVSAVGIFVALENKNCCDMNMHLERLVDFGNNKPF